MGVHTRGAGPLGCGRVRRWQATVVTLVVGPVALVALVTSVPLFVFAPVAGVVVLLGGAGLLSIAVAPWWLWYVQKHGSLVGAGSARPDGWLESAMTAPREASSAQERAVMIPGSPAVGEGAGEPAWRQLVAARAAGAPAASAVRLCFRLETGRRVDLDNLVRPALAGLRDAGVFSHGFAALEALSAEKAPAQHPGVHIALVRPDVIAALSPPGPVELAVASPAVPTDGDRQAKATWRTRVQQACARPAGEGPVFVDLAVRDRRSLAGVLGPVIDGLEAYLGRDTRSHAGIAARGDRVAWLRVQRVAGLPVGLVLSAGPITPAPGGATETAAAAAGPIVRPANPRASESRLHVPRGAPPGESTVYAEPAHHVVELDVQPRLESWERGDHPAQVALRGYVDHLHELLAPRLRDHADRELALRLVVGLPLHAPLMGAGGDLDNYLLPVVRRLGADRFACAWAVKHHGASSIAVEPASTVGTHTLQDWNAATVQPGGSAQARAWKEDIAAQLPAQPASDHPLEVQLCFRVGPRRNWTTLWKPAIDALGPILGDDPAGRPFHPRDDRITRLGLHRNLDPHAGSEVTIGIWWRPAPTTPQG